ncbi:MAG: NnrS family protein [SAR324 cluster bacterium]|nr:NnrS family protein [SAR324 cluster bacterium]
MPNQTPRSLNQWPLLDLGFRIFFIGAMLYAVIAMGIWMAAYQHGWSTGTISSMTWHAHEMIFGYTLAVIAGFLLTAIKNWTGIQTVRGVPLLGLFALWVTGRIVFFLSGMIPLEVIALIDNLFIALLTVAVSYPILKARQWRNTSSAAKVLSLLLCNIAFYLGVLGLWPEGLRIGLYGGFYIIIALIMTIGRRIIPFFTERGVGYPVTLKNWKWIDWSSILVFVIFWVFELIEPFSPVTAGLSAVLALVHGIRLVGWYTPGIWKKPLLWILFVAYGALVLGFVMKALTFVTGLSPFLALHAFAIGGVGLLTVGMMARVSLGHTGRNVQQPPAKISYVFFALTASFVFRVVLPLVHQELYGHWVMISQFLWILGFSGMLILYFPMLISHRTDGKSN